MPSIHPDWSKSLHVKAVTDLSSRGGGQSGAGAPTATHTQFGELVSSSVSVVIINVTSYVH